MSQALSRTILTALIVAASAGTVTVPAAAAKIDHVSLGDGVELITIEGDIRGGDETIFRRLSVQYDNAVVALASDGGALTPAIEIGKMIRLREFRTLVMDGYQCTSACALIWVAGSTRFLAPGGRVGFHASYRDEGGKKVETGLGNALVGRYLTLLNLPEKAVLFATMAPPDQILWLTSSTMRDAGIEFQTFNTEPSPPPIVRTNVAPPPVASRSRPQVYGEAGGWTIRKSASGCYMSSAYEGDAMLTVLSDDYDKLMFWVQDKSWASLRTDQRYQLDIEFDNWGVWPQTAVVHSDQDGPGLLWSRPIAANEDGDSFVGEFAVASRMHIRRNGKHVATFTLPGTRAATLKLIECARSGGR